MVVFKYNKNVTLRLWVINTKNTELKRLNREQLIEIIYQLRKEQMSLENENKELKKKLEERHISISKAGSIAEAVIEITGIFQKAQEAADLYLNEVKNNAENIKPTEKSDNESKDNTETQTQDTTQPDAEHTDAISEKIDKIKKSRRRK